MTTIRQLIQNRPAKANELFAKLGDTSDTAVKTRERLFAELKEELELLARLEEEHISMRVADEAAGVIQARANAKSDRVRQVA